MTSSNPCSIHAGRDAVAVIGNSDDGHIWLCGDCLLVRKPVVFVSVHQPGIPGWKPSIHVPTC